jgi:hypothetical protein
MATDKQVKLEQNQFYQPTEADKEITATRLAGIRAHLPWSMGF